MLLDMDDKLTGMWSALKQSNKLPADSLLMGNCETELQELMKQVDIMMHNKCMDWDKERQHLQSQLQLREQESLLNVRSLKQKERTIAGLEQKVDTMQTSYTDMVLQYETELNKLKDQVSTMKRSHDKLQGKYQKHAKAAKEKAEAEKLQEEKEAQTKESYKKRVAELDKELNDRDKVTAGLSEKIAALEKQIREQEEVLERRTAEVHVANAQLEALRLENRHLRKTAINSTNTATSEAAVVEGSLTEIKQMYNESLGKLESENHRLNSEVSRLRDELRNMEKATRRQIQGSRQETEQTISHLHKQQKRQLSDIEASSHHQVRDLQQQLTSTIRKYEETIRTLQEENSNLREEMDMQNRSLRRLELEHGAMTEFAVGVDEIMKIPVYSGDKFTPIDIPREKDTHTPTPPNSDYEGDLSSERLSLMDGFMLEEEERAKELERKLDKHIEELKEATHQTLVKYHNVSSNSHN